MGKASWVDVVEAAYDVEATEDLWLQGIAKATEPLVEDGFGLFAFTYDASVPEAMSIGTFASTGKHTGFDGPSALAGIQAAGGGNYVRSTFRTLQVETVRNTPGFAGSGAEQIFDAQGIGDLLVINGMDPSGIGACMGAVTSKRTKLSRVRRERYGRVATHLANSYRLRRRLAAPSSAPPPPMAPWGAEAVLSARGALDHCADDDVYSARQQLREAAVAIDRSRGSLRRSEPDAALEGWLGLVDGRWSLVDKFDGDGKRFVLARRNEPHVGGLELLTERERAVAAYAAMGHTNKMIAYELGIAHSTVRVLLARAAAKVGVRSRDEFVRIVSAATEAR